MTVICLICACAGLLFLIVMIFMRTEDVIAGFRSRISRCEEELKRTTEAFSDYKSKVGPIMEDTQKVNHELNESIQKINLTFAGIAEEIHAITEETEVEQDG